MASEQFVLLLQIGDRPGAVTEGIADTGGARSLVDLNSAQSLGLNVTRAKGTEFGTFYGPASELRAYAGVVRGPVAFRFSQEVVVYIRELKVIEHAEPLVLVGANVLCAGHPGWTFRSLGIDWDGQGIISFSRGKRMRTLPLVSAPHLANLGHPVEQQLPVASSGEGTNIGAGRTASFVSLAGGRGQCL